MPSRTLNIPKSSERHTSLAGMIGSRVILARKAHDGRKGAWHDAERAMLAYVPETDSDRRRSKARDDGKPSYTTIKIPYTYAQVMAAHTYLTSVFFARQPVHQLAGRNGTGEQATQAMEALLQYQVDVGQMMAPYYLWLYDAPKYGAGIIGEYWDKQIIQYSEIAYQPQPDGTEKLVQTSKQIAGYEGNCIYNVSPFDFMHDPRVTLNNFQKGEFCVIRRAVPWNEIVRRRALGYYNDNTKLLKTSGAARDINGREGGSPLQLPDTNLVIEDNDGKHPPIVHVYEVYVDLIQKEWGLGDSMYPEKWVFSITQDLDVIIGIAPLGLMHGQFPFSVAATELDAYAMFTRGIPEIMSGIQDTMDWLVNSHFYNVRQALNNQFIGDPSRLMMKDVSKSGEPGFFFRVRPEGYGQDVRTILTQIPVTDVTQAHMNDLTAMFGIGERVTGINDQMLGMLASGGRKTATEVRTSTGFGVNRLKTVSEFVSAIGFGTHAQRMLQTTQQFYTQQLKLRIVGDAAQMAGTTFLDVTPEMIAGQFDFQQVDGTLPVDRLAQANLWKEIMMSFKMVPELLQQYDIGKIFAWTAQLAGLKNIQQFKIQPMDPNVLAQQAQAGNVVPINGPSGMGPGADSATTAGLRALSPLAA